MSTYYNASEVETATINLVAANPARVRLLALPEPTFEGRSIYALHLSTTGWAPQTPVFMVVGGLHGCEWGSSEIVLNLAADLLGADAAGSGLDYGGWRVDQADVAQLLNDMDLVLLPLANPDGRHHSQTKDTDWRKNRNAAYAGGDPAAVGVDINRNFDFLFDIASAFKPGSLGLSVSTDKTSRVYQGPWASSEAETRNLAYLVKRFKSLHCFVDLHSGAKGVVYPWGDDQVQHTYADQSFRNPAFNLQRGSPSDVYAEYMPLPLHERHLTLAQAFAAAAGAVDGDVWGDTSAFKFQPCCGTSTDWVHSRAYHHHGKPKTLAFAIEWFGDGGYNPWWEEMPQVIRAVSAGLLAMALAAQPSS